MFEVYLRTQNRFYYTRVSVKLVYYYARQYFLMNFFRSCVIKSKEILKCYMYTGAIFFNIEQNKGASLYQAMNTALNGIICLFIVLLLKRPHGVSKVLLHVHRFFLSSFLCPSIDIQKFTLLLIYKSSMWFSLFRYYQSFRKGVASLEQM